MRSSFPHGFAFVVSSSAAASSAQSGIDAALVDIFVAPSCIPLPLLADVRERVGAASEENVGVRGTGPEESPSTLSPPGMGAEVGRSMPAPEAVVIVLCRSPAASWKYDTVRIIDQPTGVTVYLLSKRRDRPTSQRPCGSCCTIHKRIWRAPIDLDLRDLSLGINSFRLSKVSFLSS